jgi:hypothetical protein
MKTIVGCAFNTQWGKAASGLCPLGYVLFAWRPDKVGMPMQTL